MDDVPIGPTRRYVIVCHDGSRIDVDAESMWPTGQTLEFWATLDVIGPRQAPEGRVAGLPSMMSTGYQRASRRPRPS